MIMLRNYYLKGVLLLKHKNSCLVNASLNFSNNSLNANNIRKMKRLFSTFLFGGTFITVLVMRKRREMQLADMFKDCKLIQYDINVKPPLKIYDYKGYILPEHVIKGMKTLDKFKVREDDIFVASFPKTGSTWAQEIVYLIATGFDLEKAKGTGLETRFPYLEYPYPGLKAIESATSPRFIKTHLPYGLLPPDVKAKSPKILYIMRNPKDVAVSYYHHFLRTNNLNEQDGSISEFLEKFMKGEVPYGPIWRHFLEYWEVKDSANVLIIFYEDFHKDFAACVERIMHFLEKSLTSEQMEKLQEHCSFKEMSKNPSLNYQFWDFRDLMKGTGPACMRKGIVGDWQNYFTKDTNQSIDKWVEEKFDSLQSQFVYNMPAEPKRKSSSGGYFL